MGHFKVPYIEYNNRHWQPEDLIASGHCYAERVRYAEAVEIAAHIMATAHLTQDETLFNAGLELMRSAHSPCSFRADSSALQASDDNNRPTPPLPPIIPDGLYNVDEEVEKEWDKSLDYIFDPRVNAQKVFVAMKKIMAEKGKKYNNKITDKRFYYVVYRILLVINYFSNGTTPKNYLKWINLHFKHNWPEDKFHLRFQLEGSAKELADYQPSEWNSCMDYAGLGKLHYRLAIDLKNTFTFVVDEKEVIKDSELYEHLKDYPQFLSGAILVYDKWHVPDEAFINKG